MITIYVHKDGRLTATQVNAADLDLAELQPVWIDMEHPSEEDIQSVAKRFDIELPSAADMREIETSSRLYHDGAAHVMTASIVYRIESQVPLSAEITFVLMPHVLITLRFSTPRAFALFAGHASDGDIVCDSPESVTIGLIEAIVERQADLIERLQDETEAISKQIFETDGKEQTRTKHHAASLKEIGRKSVILSRTRESLVSLGRLLTYFRNLTQAGNVPETIRQRIKTTHNDVQSIAAHIDHLTSRLTFMMDATIGLVGIEQNQIIKLFSVVAVMLMPPTLIASVYGMNFNHMPELAYVWAYPAVLTAMVVSAVLPFLYFKHKGWL